MKIKCSLKIKKILLRVIFPIKKSKVSPLLKSAQVKENVSAADLEQIRNNQIVNKVRIITILIFV